MDRRTPAFVSSFLGISAYRHRSSCISNVTTSNSNSSPRIATIRMADGHQSSAAPPAHNLAISRRSFLRSASLLSIASLLVTETSVKQSNAEAAEFSNYKGPISLGYSFSYPSSWLVKKKPIKTHLSEIIVTDSAEASTSAGLVVDAVKIDSIDKFGTPDAVGQKVVAVETKKESVKEAYVTAATSQTKDGLVYYVIDYTVDSTRGVKRYKAKATVTGNQLYVFTAQAKVDNFEGEVENTFAQMLDSFNVVKQYL